MNKFKRAYRGLDLYRHGLKASVDECVDLDEDMRWFAPFVRDVVVLASDVDSHQCLVRDCATGIVELVGINFIKPRVKSQRWSCEADYAGPKHLHKWETYLRAVRLPTLEEWCKKHKYVHVYDLAIKQGLIKDIYDEILFHDGLALGDRVLCSSQEYLHEDAILTLAAKLPKFFQKG